GCPRKEIVGQPSLGFLLVSDMRWGKTTTRNSTGADPTDARRPEAASEPPHPISGPGCISPSAGPGARGPRPTCNGGSDAPPPSLGARVPAAGRPGPRSTGPGRGGRRTAGG